MGESFDRLMGAAGAVAGAAVKTTGRIVDMGRCKAEELALQNRLGKLQRQLGALVYALRKNGESNEAMIAWYVTEIDSIKQKLLALQAAAARGGAEDAGYAMFRGGGGD